MISKSEIKFLKSLNLLKFRNTHNVFKVEGWRSLKEFLQTDYKLVQIFCTSEWLSNHQRVQKKCQLITEKQLKTISSLKSPNQIVGVFETKEFKVNYKSLHNQIVIFLEEVTNPGNLGSIIRTADWFGVKNIICSNGSVDLYNPKVVQSSMGSLSRISVSYVDLEEFILNVRKYNIFSLAADLNGEDIYNQKKISAGIIFFGNESKGISEKIKSLVSRRIKIPSYNHHCESLNLSVSSGIIISELFRKKS